MREYIVLAMVFIILIIAATVGIKGCISTAHKISNESIRVSSGATHARIEKVLIDGCQYLVLMGNEKGGIVAAVNQPVTCKRWNNLDIEK